MTRSRNYRKITSIHRKLHQQHLERKQRLMSGSNRNRKPDDNPESDGDEGPDQRPSSPITQQSVQLCENSLSMETVGKSAMHKTFQKSWTRMVELVIAEKYNAIETILSQDEAGTFELIMAEICLKHSVSVMEIMSSRRALRLVMARYELAHRCKNETLLTVPQIAAKMGGRDHTTIMNQIEQWQRLLDIKAGDRSQIRASDIRVDWGLVC